MSNLVRTTTRRRAVVGGLAGAALLTAAGAAAYAEMTTTVTLSVEGQTSEVRTGEDTVAGVLASQGVEVGDRDVVAPALGTELEEGDTVAVRFAKPVDLAVDGDESTHWVLATDVSTALGEIGERFVDADLSVSRSAPIGRDGVSLDVVTPKSVTVKIADDKASKHDIAVMTTGGVLTELGVEPDLDDKVEVKRPGKRAEVAAYDTEVSDGDRVVFSKVSTKRVSRRVDIAPGTQRRADSSMLRGRSSVVSEGRPGVRRIVTDVTREDGKVVERDRVRAKQLRAPSARVVAYGTKQRPAPEPTPAPQPAAPSTPSAPSPSPAAPSAPAPSPSASSAPSGGSNFASGSSVWDSIAACESGGNWAINTGNGYYGGLQFNLATWQGYGGTGYPHQASRSTQIAIAENVRAARGGYGSWPSCSQKLGLPQ